MNRQGGSFVLSVQRQCDERGGSDSERKEETGIKTITAKQKAALFAGGAITGSANGLLGGGGGMIAVPVLQKCAGMSAQTSHATAIAVILPASVVSSAIYLWRGLTPLSLLVPTAIGTVAGGFFGAKLLGKIKPRPLTFAFALVMLLAGARSVL